MTLAELKDLIQDKYLNHGDYTLSSGAKSKLYFDIKGMMGDYDGMAKLLNELYKKLPQYDTFACLGGTELGGVPLVAALWMSEQLYEYSVCYIRKSLPREHGLKKMIEGAPKSPILLVDDVLYSGITIRKAVMSCYNEGYTVAGIICVVNRTASLTSDNIPTEIFRFQKYDLGKNEDDIDIPVYSLFKESDFQ